MSSPQDRRGSLADAVYTAEDLHVMQHWPLERKIQVTQTRIIEWHERLNGQCSLSFSGGKDSTVLLDLARRIYPDIPAVYVDAGLDFPEIKQFVRSFENVTILRPVKTFRQVLDEYGYPVVSKEVSKIIYGIRNSPKPESYWCKINGTNRDGSYSKYRQRYVKWRFLLDAPFKISNRCCYWMKEKPLASYGRDSGRFPIIATMAQDSLQRRYGYLKAGCNAFTASTKRSTPMGFWTEQDVLQYLRVTDIPYCSVYGDIIESKGRLETTGEHRTGCIFCMYGCHLDKINRFQRLARTHPKLYAYCIDTLGCGEVLNYLGVEYS